MKHEKRLSDYLKDHYRSVLEDAIEETEKPPKMTELEQAMSLPIPDDYEWRIDTVDGLWWVSLAFNEALDCGHYTICCESDGTENLADGMFETWAMWYGIELGQGVNDDT